MPSRWKSLQVHALVGAKEITFTCRSEEYCCDLVRPGQRLVRYGHYFVGLVERSSAPRMEVPETLRRHQIESARAADFDVLLQEAAS